MKRSFVSLQSLLLGTALLIPTAADASLCVCRSKTYVWPRPTGPIPVNTVFTVWSELVERLRLTDKTRSQALKQVRPLNSFLWTRVIYPHFTLGETFVIEHQEQDGTWRPISSTFTSNGIFDREEPRWSGKVSGTFARTGDVPDSCRGTYEIKLHISDDGFVDDTTPFRDLRWAVWYDRRVGSLVPGGEAPLLGDPPTLVRLLDESGAMSIRDGRDQCPIELNIPSDVSQLTLWVAPIDHAGHVGAVARVPLVDAQKR